MILASDGNGDMIRSIPQCQTTDYTLRGRNV